MDIAQFSIEKRVIIWTMIILFITGGIFAYNHLGRYEDPEFTIKDAKVITLYPGATPTEVEEEVTDRIEKSIHELSQIKRTTSISQTGYSEITATIKDKYDKNDLPQIWDELRRKVVDVQQQLPPGAGPSIVYDDFGDVYGLLFALTGQGFSYRELKRYSDILKRELELVPGVAKVQVAGVWQEAIFVDVARSKLAQLGISLDEIYALLESQNVVADSGHVRVGDEYVVIQPSGAIDSVEAIGNLLLPSTIATRQVYLKDIAKISRSYVEVPDQLIYHDGQAALTIGISIVSGGNVVQIGKSVEQKIDDISQLIPVGLQLLPIYEQPEVVAKSIKDFMTSLYQALAIVVGVLLFAMGLRSGLIIAAILLLTVLGTLFFMLIFSIDLQRVSLGALIIALGMLVDNAIVVTEGILVKVQQGMQRLRASQEVLRQTMWPLLGATVIGIIAFAPIGLSQDATGEYTQSLFYVIGISLLLSWLLAITVGPLFCHDYLKTEEKPPPAKAEPYRHPLYTAYSGLLQKCLRHSWLTVGVMIILLGAGVFGFGKIKEGFFPDSSTPIFLVDYWRAEGTDIRALRDDMLVIEQDILQIPDVTHVTSQIGQGAQRFMLVYDPESPNSSYGQFIVRVDDYHAIDQIAPQVKQLIADNFPDSETKIRRIRLGPGKGSKIEARFSGPDPEVLRDLSRQAQAIMRDHPGAIDVRDDWRQPVKVAHPVYAEQAARAAGITRNDLSDALLSAFSGKQVGIYRERDELIPIISRPPDEERLNIGSLVDLQIWSPTLRRTVPIMQVTSHIETKWQDNTIHRRNRKRTITVSSEPDFDVMTSTVFNDIKPQIEAIPLPPGYELEWGGEYESASDAQTALYQQMPLGFIAMFLIVVALFNAVRQALIIWLCVPLAIVGVTMGLLITGKPFDFMGLLGFLSLIGMLIKNAIVLVDQIDLERTQAKPLLPAIIDSSLSRARPVVLAALTTILGMVPLLSDAFFVSMAIVIMFGLTFATLLTLIVVPVLYKLFFGYRDSTKQQVTSSQTLSS
jgi:multidrug efflux pump subunit AcrB